MHLDVGDLSSGVIPFVVRWNREEECWDLRESMPRRPSYETVYWCLWYYLRGGTTPKARQVTKLADNLLHAEEGILNAVSHSPKSVLSRIGDISVFNDWGTALFYVAMKGLHPLLRAHKYYENLRSAATSGDEEQFGFEIMNDYRIWIEPDLRTATGYAFDYFREVAKGEDAKAAGTPGTGGEVKPDGPAAPNMLWSGGKPYALEPRQWRLLNFMWDKTEATQQAVVKAVWGDPLTKSGTLRATISKLNSRLLEIGIRPLPSFSCSGGYVVKTS